MTNDLTRRIYEHKNRLVEGFTKKYNLTKLVYYEITTDVESAIRREKQLEDWHRDWKVNLINQFNHKWDDLIKCLWEMLKRVMLKQVQHDNFVSE